MKYYWHSFRPLTGIMVLIEEAIRNYVEHLIGFPSPYGDYGSYRGVYGWNADVFILFPSPYGDYGSYLTLSRLASPSVTKVSVPLRGLWFLSWCGLFSFNESDDDVSVPLRGLWFLSVYGRLAIAILMRRFRPLTGIMVLIRTPYKWLHSAIENAFCEADFLFSSFFTFLRKMIFKNRPIADF